MYFVNKGWWHYFHSLETFLFPWIQYFQEFILLYFKTGETCEASVGEAESKSVCLKTEMVFKLAGLAIQMEKRFGGPRDIEFAIKGVILIRWILLKA